MAIKGDYKNIFFKITYVGAVYKYSTSNIIT